MLFAVNLIKLGDNIYQSVALIGGAIFLSMVIVYGLVALASRSILVFVLVMVLATGTGIMVNRPDFIKGASDSTANILENGPGAGQAPASGQGTGETQTTRPLR